MAGSKNKIVRTSSVKVSEAGSATKMPITEKAFEQAVAMDPEGRFMLTLYVSGMTPRSQRAIDNIQSLCEEHMSGRYDLKIIDIYQQPGAAKDAQIIAVPTLIKRLPPPLRRLIGDMGDPGRVLLALGLVDSRAAGKLKAKGMAKAKVKPKATSRKK